jgi:hypothetical protein
MPEAAYRNLKEIPDEDVRKRVLSYIFWKYRKVYMAIESLGVTIGGPEGIFKTFRPTPGAINGPGGMTADAIFKLPSNVDEGFDNQAILGLICPAVSIPLEGSRNGVKADTNRHPTISHIEDSVRHISAAPPYRDWRSRNEDYSIVDIIRGNLEMAGYRKVRKRAFYEYPRHGLTRRVPQSKLPKRYANDSYESAENVRVDFLLKQDPEDLCIPGRAFRLGTGQVMDDLIDVPPFHTPIGYFSSAFTSDFPVGTSLRELSHRSSHWFIDLANTFPSRFRESQGIFSIKEYLAPIKPNRLPVGTVIYLVTEIPGRPCMISVDDSLRQIDVQRGFKPPVFDHVVVRCHPRVAGHGGADIEFKSLLSIIRKFNCDAKLYYTSRDGDWAGSARSFGAMKRQINFSA